MNFKAFKAIRPTVNLASRVAAPPYDVLDDKAARKFAEDEYSIVHITRSEVNFPETINPYDQVVYNNAKDTMLEFIDKNILEIENKPVYYLYQEIFNGNSQVGIVGTISTEDYRQGKIKKHEFTLEEKEIDRINHFFTTRCHTESVFLFFEENLELEKLIHEILDNNNPIINFKDTAGVDQKLFRIDDDEIIENIAEKFKNINALYIADGHHRTESSAKVGEKVEEIEGVKGEHNYILATVFPEKEINIMSYNRVVKDLNGLTEDEFLDKIIKHFEIIEVNDLIHPKNKREFSMILGSKYYKLIPKDELYLNKNIVDSLDVSVLGEYVLDDILGIKDIRRDNRIEFYGGTDVINQIKSRINDGMAVGFLLYPVTTQDIREISDNDLIMPPKSTWFEPKIISGLFMHKF